MAATVPQQPSSAQIHRRETLLQVVLPLVGGLVLLLLLLLMALLLPRRLQVSLVADLMMTCMFLCPAVICVFPLYVILMVMAFGMNSVHDLAGRSLGRLQDFSRSVSEKAVETTDTINQKTVDISAKLAAADKILGTFDRPAAQEESHESDN